MDGRELGLMNVMNGGVCFTFFWEKGVATIASSLFSLLSFLLACLHHISSLLHCGDVGYPPDEHSRDVWGVFH